MAWGHRSSNFVRWYSNKSSTILDKMCCCSYLDAQICGEVPVDDYYKKRSTTIPTEWMFNPEFLEDDDPLSRFKRTNGDGKLKFSKHDRLGVDPSSCKLTPSTATTVTMQTQSYDDSDRSVSSCETVRVTNRSTEIWSFYASEAASFDLDSTFDSCFDSSTTKRDSSVASEDFAEGYKKHTGTRKMKSRYCEKVVLCRARTPEGRGRLPQTNTVSEGQRLQMLII